MQSPLITHPPTPRYDPRYANKPASDAVRHALDSDRDFSWLMTAGEIEATRLAAEQQAASWGYRGGYRWNNGD